MTEKLSQEIERRLKEAGLTAITAAKKANLSRDAIRDILRGKSLNPSHETLSKIAAVLGCTVEDLYNEDPRYAQLRESSQQLAHHVYAMFQYRMAELLGELCKVDTKTAQILYFGISQGVAREQTLDRLKQLRFGDSYGPYWKTFLEEAARVHADYAAGTGWWPFDGKRENYLANFMRRATDVMLAGSAFSERLGTNPQEAALIEEILNAPLVIPVPKDHPLQAWRAYLRSFAEKGDVAR